MAQGERLRKIHDAHVRALQSRKGRRPVVEHDDDMISSAEAARRLGLTLGTFYGRIKEPQFRQLAHEVEGSGGDAGIVLRWRWGDLLQVRDSIKAPSRARGGPGHVSEENRNPMSSMYTGRRGEQVPTAKRVAVVDLPRQGTYSIYEVRPGQHVPNRAADLEPGLWATDGARTMRCPWSLDELARTLTEGEPAPDGARYFAPYQEGTGVRQLQD